MELEHEPADAPIGPTPKPLTAEALIRLNDDDRDQLRQRYNHPHVCWHPEARDVILSLLKRLEVVETKRDKYRWSYEDRCKKYDAALAETERLKDAVKAYLDAPPSGIVDHHALENYLRKLCGLPIEHDAG